MWSQVRAIAWAQFRSSRNRFPRTSAGTVLSWLLSSLWYGLYAGLAVFLAVKLPDLEMPVLLRWMPVALLAVFAFWQLMPLGTLSSGWSLQLNKLQIYPIPSSALFGIEVFLRVTSAPEMIVVLLGTAVGLLRHPAVPVLAPLLLLLFIPFNLLLQLGVRDLVLHSFERNRFRELFTALIITAGVIPNLLARTALGNRLKPHFLRFARAPLSPWAASSSLGLGRHPLLPALVSMLFWIAAAYLFARWMFAKSLVADDSLARSARQPSERSRSLRSAFSSWPSQIFGDPLGALLQKELRSLVRMPKFRVLFGMACLLGAIVFIPASLNGRDPGAEFMRNNLMGVVNLYGLLLLSDTLLLNAFGLDRSAAQVYFVSPVSFSTVLIAKNLTALVFVTLQTCIILCVALLAHAPLTGLGLLSGLLASGVVTVFLLAIGNLTSLTMARPIDPKQTFKKQAGAKTTIWFLLSSAGLVIVVGFAFLARYAFRSDGVFLGVLAFEFAVGLLVYRLGLETAVERGRRDREAIVEALSRSGSPVSLS